jgi:hypothetical protein
MQPNAIWWWLVSIAVVLGLCPLIFLVSFLVKGRKLRKEKLKQTVNKDTKAKKLVPEEAAGEAEDISMEQFLLARFDEFQDARNYVLPLICFFIPMIVGLSVSVQGIYLFITAGTGKWPEQQIYLASIGFMGACLLIIGHLASRVVRNDIQPGTFHHLTMRLFLAPALALLVTSVVTTDRFPAALSCIAFGVGLFPAIATRKLASWFSNLLGGKNQSVLPLSCIQGLDADDELRLWEEGITDAEQLAVARTQDLMVKTSYGLDRIIDWKDQAFLFMYVGDKLQNWRDVHIRGALDVLGLAPRYYGERTETMEQTLATTMGKPVEIIQRLIDTIDNDPRVHQLWQFLVSAYPTRIAERLKADNVETEIVSVRVAEAIAEGEAHKDAAQSNAARGAYRENGDF